MRQQLSNELYKKYPSIFTKTFHHIEAGDGWYELIDTLCNTMQNYINNVKENREWILEHNLKKQQDPTYDYVPRGLPNAVEQVVAVQMKQKFGTLRIYCVGGDSITSGMISMAESMSERICEQCGAPGKMRGDVWARVQCEQHHVAQALGAGDNFMV